MRRAPELLPTLLGAYASVAAVAAAITVLLGRDPWATASWVGLGGAAAHGWSLALGLLLGVATILATRVIVPRAAWGRALHAELRPAVRGVAGGPLALMALASGVAEEVFFRGLLTPLLGVVLSSLAFGLVHQTRGRARWTWAVWAGVMGLLFALVFELTGSLLGPVVAHVLINGANLRFLRDTDIERPPRPLGGLLDRA